MQSSREMPMVRLLLRQKKRRTKGASSSSAASSAKIDVSPPAPHALPSPYARTDTFAIRESGHEQYANLLCTTVNPSYGALLRWMEAHDPRSSRQNPLGVFKLFLRLIVAAQRDGFPSSSVSGGQESSRDLLERTESLAAVNERTRRQRESQMLADMQWGEDWLTAFRLILEALQLPLKYYASSAAIPALRDGAAAGEEQESHQPKHPGDTLLPAPVGALPSWYTKDLPTELADKLLGFDNFLVWWGRVALNQEDDGGIFILHPCLNHS